MWFGVREGKRSPAEGTFRPKGNETPTIKGWEREAPKEKAPPEDKKNQRESSVAPNAADKFSKFQMCPQNLAEAVDFRPEGNFSRLRVPETQRLG